MNKTSRHERRANAILNSYLGRPLAVPSAPQSRYSIEQHACFPKRWFIARDGEALLERAGCHLLKGPTAKASLRRWQKLERLIERLEVLIREQETKADANQPTEATPVQPL